MIQKIKYLSLMSLAVPAIGIGISIQKMGSWVRSEKVEFFGGAVGTVGLLLLNQAEEESRLNIFNHPR